MCIFQFWIYSASLWRPYWSRTDTTGSTAYSGHKNTNRTVWRSLVAVDLSGPNRNTGLSSHKQGRFRVPVFACSMRFARWMWVQWVAATLVNHVVSGLLLVVLTCSYQQETLFCTNSTATYMLSHCLIEAKMDLFIGNYTLVIFKLKTIKLVNTDSKEHALQKSLQT